VSRKSLNAVAPAFARAAQYRDAYRDTPAGTAGPRTSPWLRDDRHWLPIGALVVALVWTLTVLMIVPDGFDYGDLTSAGAPTSGGFVSRVLWLSLLGGGLLVIAWRASLAWRLLTSLNPFLIAFLVLVAASAAWSIEPAITVRRLIRVITIVVVAMAFVLVVWHAQRFQNVLRPIVTMVLVGSVIFGLGWPQFAIHQATTGVLVGAWHGLANHKNSFGDIAAVGLIFWVHGWLSKSVHTLAALFGAGLAITCLLLSHSSTSLVATLFTLLLMTTLLRCPPALRPFVPYLITGLLATLLAYSLAVLDLVPGLNVLLSPISMITGKDSSFTGRTEIWDILWQQIALHPYLGSGYGAYWTGPVMGSPSYEFVQRLNFYPGSAHNGYLEILNDLGTVGLIILVGYLVGFVVQTLRLLRIDRTQATLYLALFLQQSISNLSESRWLNAFSVDFVFMTLATTALARGLLEQRLRNELGQPWQGRPTPLSARFVNSDAA